MIIQHDSIDKLSVTGKQSSYYYANSYELQQQLHSNILRVSVEHKNVQRSALRINTALRGVAATGLGHDLLRLPLMRLPLIRVSD